MSSPRPLSPAEYDSFFSDKPGQYPGYLGHSTLSLSPANEQPPTILQRGPLDPTVKVTEAQADHFVRHGFVIVEGLIPEEQLESWRAQFWDVIGAGPHDSDGWPGATFEGTVWDQNRKGPCVNALNPPVGHHPRVRAVVAQLGGVDMAEGQRPKMLARPQEPIDHAVVHFAPAADVRDRNLPPAPPIGGHIDGANPPKGGWVGGCAIVASTYLFDVAAKGGGTCFFPGSHTAVGKFFEKKPTQFTSGEFGRRFGYGVYHDQDLFEYGGSGDHIIATMRAGSVCFAHGYLVHTTTPNLTPDTIRLGIFSRWHFADMAAKREDAPRDMWKYWNGEAVLAALRRAKGEEQPVRTVLESKVTVTEGGWRYFEGSVQYSTEGVSSRL